MTVETEMSGADPGESLGGKMSKGRLRLITIDQMLSGGSNVLVAVAAAHLLATASFGLYALVAIAYMLSLGVVRALVNDPTLVHPEEATVRQAEVVGANLVLGTGVGALVAGAGGLVLLGSTTLGWALIILGACMPMLALQDLGRYLAIVSQRPERAIVLDGLWLLLLAVSLPLLVVSGQRNLPMFIFAWGFAGGVAALLVPFYSGRPFARNGVQWLRYTWWFSWRYLASYVATQSAALGAMAGVGTIAGNAALGGVQGSILLVRPYGLFQAAVVSSTVSEIARSNAGAEEVRTHGLRASRFAALVAAANGLVIVLLPTFLGKVLLGETWYAARPLLLATGVQIVMIGLQTGMRAALLGRRQVQYTTAIDIASTGFTVVGIFVGTYLDGARGAVWGATIAAAISVVMWWRMFRWRESVGAFEPIQDS